MKKECKKHGLTEFVLDSAGYLRCKKCRTEAVIKKRHLNKLKLVEYKGGKCEICGYNRCLDALEFHHKDPKEKSFSISSKNIKSFDKLRSEADKCILVCSNCHKEIHSDLNKKDLLELVENSSTTTLSKNFKRNTLDFDRITKDIKDGLTQKEISNKYNISVSTLKRFLKKNK